MGSVKPILLVGCAALAGEIAALARLNQWDHIEFKWLPAELHNRPERIAGAVEEILGSAKGLYQDVLVAYGDCGTVGELDRVLDRHGARRLPGEHCYGFLAGPERFSDFHEEEPGTFYLTDFLVRNFDRLVIRGLGLDEHPELRDAYFGHYKRVMYLAQEGASGLKERAEACARRLELDFCMHTTGLAPLERAMAIAPPEGAEPEVGD